MEAGQQPKYLNSPETPIYVKGRTLYGLHLSKAAITRAKHAVMVEGYFDVAQALQAGITERRRLVRNGADAGPGAAAETFRVARSSSASIPTRRARGRRRGRRRCWSPKGSRSTWQCCRRATIPIISFGSRAGRPTRNKLRDSRPYLEYLLDRAAAEHDFARTRIGGSFWGRCWTVAARIPDAAARDQFADRLAHKAQDNGRGGSGGNSQGRCPEADDGARRSAGCPASAR